jgi:hypothetical protein
MQTYTGARHVRLHNRACRYCCLSSSTQSDPSGFSSQAHRPWSTVLKPEDAERCHFFFIYPLVAARRDQRSVITRSRQNVLVPCVPAYVCRGKRALAIILAPRDDAVQVNRLPGCAVQAGMCWGIMWGASACRCTESIPGARVCSVVQKPEGLPPSPRSRAGDCFSRPAGSNALTS